MVCLALLSCRQRSGLIFSKVQIFWEAHKILQNLHLTFSLCSVSQKLAEDFAKFCGLLRIYEFFKKGFKIEVKKKYFSKKCAPKFLFFNEKNQKDSHSMARANLNKSKKVLTSTTTASKYIPMRPRICINWNPPFQISFHKIFKNYFLLSKSCFTMFTFRGSLLSKFWSERGDFNWCRLWASWVCTLMLWQ